MMHHKDIPLLKNDKWTPGGHLIDIWWTQLSYVTQKLKMESTGVPSIFKNHFFDVIIIVIHIIPKGKLHTVTRSNIW